MIEHVKIKSRSNKRIDIGNAYWKAVLTSLTCVRNFPKLTGKEHIKIFEQEVYQKRCTNRLVFQFRGRGWLCKCKTMGKWRTKMLTWPLPTTFCIIQGLILLEQQESKGRTKTQTHGRPGTEWMGLTDREGIAPRSSRSLLYTVELGVGLLHRTEQGGRGIIYCWTRCTCHSRSSFFLEAVFRLYTIEQKKQSQNICNMLPLHDV